MSVGDTLQAISEAGLALKAAEAEDTLRVYPPENITPELAAAIREHKRALLEIAREDEEMQRTGIIQSERQVLELASEHFGLNGKGGAA